MKQVRLELGLNQKEAALRLKVAASHLSYIESGKKTPSERLIEFFAYKFNVSIDWLMTGEGEHRSTDLAVGYYNEGIYEAWNSSAGLILKYVMIYRLLLPSANLEDDFLYLINDDDFKLLTNWIVDMLSMSNANERQSVIQRIRSAFPEFDRFHEDYIRTLSKIDDGDGQEAYKKYARPIMHEADQLLKFFENKPDVGRSGSYKKWEDAILSHRIPAIEPFV